MIIKIKLQLIHYNNVTIIIAGMNINHKTRKHMTILVIQLNKPWKRVSKEIFRQDMLGGKRHLLQEGMTKRKLESNVHTDLKF